jgi:predicted small lipoprotein YifL
MPCLCPPPLECCYYGKCPACFLCGAPAVLAVLAALAGCGRSGSTQAPPPSAINTATYAPVFADTLPPVPADVPAEVPACPAQAPVMVHDQPGFYSACSSYTYSQSPVLDIYNLSDGVLDVTPTIPPGFSLVNAGARATVYNPDPEGLPDADTLVVAAQDQVVAAAQDYERYPRLVPVGGSISLTSVSETNATVDVDPAVSEATYAAQLLASYVIDNLLETNEDSPLAYSNSIAECVNDASSRWGQLSKDQDNTQVAETIDDALKTKKSCQELQEKLSADPDEAAHLLAGEEKLDQETVSDLNEVMDKSADSGWVSDLIDAAGDIAHDIHGG